MMDPWLSSSETNRSPLLQSCGISPSFAMKPVWYVRLAGAFLNLARRRSSSSWSVMLPAIERSLPAPAPYFLVASSMALTTLGCVARFR